MKLSALCTWVFSTGDVFSHKRPLLGGCSAQHTLQEKQRKKKKVLQCGAKKEKGCHKSAKERSLLLCGCREGAEEKKMLKDTCFSRRVTRAALSAMLRCSRVEWGEKNQRTFCQQPI